MRYRWYDARKTAPLYPFGYGLSYTDFKIERLSAEADTFTDSVTVYGTNTSVKEMMENEELKTVLRVFFAETELPWTALLTSYEYTSQDTIGLILEQLNCAEADRKKLYDRMRKVKKQ